MSNTIIPEDFPYDIIHRGQQDATRHSRRVKEAAKKQLKDLISQQDIITSEGNKRVKVRLKYLDQYRFIYNRDRQGGVGRDEFDELSKGDILSKPGEGGKKPKASDDAGEDLYEAEFTIDELTQMMMEDFNLPDLQDKNRHEIVSEVIEWTDRRKGHGIEACIDKKKTILSNILRRAKLKKTKPIPIIKDDLVYRSWDTAIERHSNAVIFLLMDRSGSMIEEKIYIVKALYFWIVQFLRSKYNHVHIKFIAHDYDARELTEKEFFSISDSGGTRISAAYEMCRDMIQYNYPSDTWNVYVFHASDGDSWNDEKECISLIEEMIKLGVSLFAYSEIRLDSEGEKSELMELLEDFIKYHTEVLTATLNTPGDVVATLKKFLQHTHRRKLETASS